MLSAAAVYDMDVLNGPEIIGALLIGGAVGLLLGREWPESRLTVLLTILVIMLNLVQNRQKKNFLINKKKNH